MMKILIAAQYYRVGSTLIQRCLHQCENTKIYGEMNNLLDCAISLKTMGGRFKTKSPNEIFLQKKSNWSDKVDDDYSLCIPHEKLTALSEMLVYYTLGVESKSSENIGFKCISPTASGLVIAAEMGFKIIWVTRDVKDASNSYLSQEWNHGIAAFASAKSRSDTITNEFLEALQDKEKWAAEVYKIDYSEIHEKIGGIIESMGLRIEKEKLEAVLANKVNSGY